MTVLVWAEHTQGVLRKSAGHAVAAAAPLGPVTVLLVGAGAAAAGAAAACLQGVARVLCVGEQVIDPPPESLAPMLADQVRALAASHLVAAATPLSRATLPRLCAQLDVMQLSEVVAIEGPDTFVRPIYAGSALATLKSTDALKVLTVRVSAFPAAGVQPPAAAAVADAVAPPPVAERLAHHPRATTETDLADARVVVSGGRGMGSAAQYDLLRPLARTLNAALGASRAAVDAGYAPPERQVGQTGRIVAPEVYIAFGISGAVQHLAGMKDSRTIVAVNKDPEAPIFQVADIGLVADLFEVLPVLEQALSR